MYPWFLLLLLFLSPIRALCQVDIAKEISETIRAEDLKTHLEVIASDDFAGRETGTPGNLKAAKYIAAQFKAFGIPPVFDNGSWFQDVVISQVKWNKVDMVLDDTTKKHLRDFLALPQSSPGEELSLDPKKVTFLGYGIDDPVYSDYQGKDVEDRILLVYTGEPVDENGISRITGTRERSAWSRGIEKKLRTAKVHGAKALVIIENRLMEEIEKNRRFMFGRMILMGDATEMGSDMVHHCMISPVLAKALIGKKQRKVIRARDRIIKKGKSKAIRIPVDLQMQMDREVNTLEGQNVLGFIEGIDPELKDEIVLVTAHYDHLGQRGDDIFNGADDNGSGTSAVLEIAQAFAIAKERGLGPRRSVLCMLVTGEEKGLLGSQFYVEHPVFPLDQSVANINIDMIGRTDKHHTDSNYVYVIGSDRLSTTLHEINEEVNDKYTRLELDYTYNAEDDPNRFYYRSDHYNFAKNGIPSVFYFSGTHKDYHRPSDTADKIMYGKAETIARLAFHTAWELANRDERIEVDVR